MAYLPETSTFDVGIYQIETEDDVIGGVDGIDNKQGKALGNRTKYLKDHLDVAEGDIVTIDADLTDKETRLIALEASKIHTFGSNYAGRGIVTINSGTPVLVPGTGYGKLIILDVPGTTVTCRLPTLTGLTPGMIFDIIIMASNASYLGAAITFTSVDGTIIGNPNDFSVGDSLSFIVEASGAWIIRNGYKQSDSVKAGVVDFLARATPPAGYIAANGAAISRTTYARLFAEIGVQNGAGNGTTTFNVPDARGVFIRGLDSGRGLDASRVFGTFQSDIIKNHTHPYNDQSDGGNPPGGIATGGAASFVTVNRTTGNNTGGSAIETRPVNIALLACIKY